MEVYVYAQKLFRKIKWAWPFQNIILTSIKSTATTTTIVAELVNNIIL